VAGRLYGRRVGRFDSTWHRGGSGYEEDGFLLPDAKTARIPKRLQGDLHGFYRFRIGSYRVISQHLPNGLIQILRIVRIAPRKDVYE
jgi:mRNA-degrading endonuclease RelE of RelBE toxin-antitoxin system